MWFWGRFSLDKEKKLGQLCGKAKARCRCQLWDGHAEYELSGTILSYSSALSTTSLHFLLLNKKSKCSVCTREKLKSNNRDACPFCLYVSLRPFKVRSLWHELHKHDQNPI